MATQRFPKRFASLTKSRKYRDRARRAKESKRLQLESLEDRRLMALVPPVNGTVVGLAVTEIRPAAAAPTVILSDGFAVSAGLAPPETARISATPELPEAWNVAVATPLVVRASTGLKRPKLVENVTVVPF